MANDNILPQSAQVVADPKRPYKAYAAALVALLGSLWAALEGHKDNLGNMTLVEWLTVIVPTVLAWAATYVVENPKVVK